VHLSRLQIKYSKNSPSPAQDTHLFFCYTTSLKNEKEILAQEIINVSREISKMRAESRLTIEKA